MRKRRNVKRNQGQEGVLKYFLRGNKVVNKTYRRDFKLYFKLPIYLLVVLVLKLSIVLSPIALIVQDNFRKDMLETNDFKFSNLFNDIEFSRFKNILPMFAVMAAMIISSYLVIGFIESGILEMLLSVESFTDLIDIEQTKVVYMLVFLLVKLLVAAAIYTYFRFIVKMLIENEDITIKEAILETKRIYHGKRVFKAYLIFIIHLVSIGLLGGALYVFGLFTNLEFELYLHLLIKLLTTLLFLVILSKRIIKFMMSLDYYYTDLMKHTKADQYETNKEEKVLVDLLEGSKVVK